MSRFKINNGREGTDWCSHTPTGYQCVARYPRNEKREQTVMFSARHIVDGANRYTEIALNGLQDGERQEGMMKLKTALKKAGFTEVSDSFLIKNNKQAFAEYPTWEEDRVAVYIHDSKTSLVMAAEACSDLLFPASFDFIHEQENDEDALFFSLYNAIYQQVFGRPDGENYAESKAKQLEMHFRLGWDD